MLFLFSVWLLIESSCCELLAIFTGKSYLSYHVPAKTDATNSHFTFKTEFAYGSLLSVYDSSHLLYRISIENRTLTAEHDKLSVTLCSNCLALKHWNTISVTHNADFNVSVLINSRLTQFRPFNRQNFSEISVYVGGLHSNSSMPYHQYNGYIRDINLFGCNVLEDHNDDVKSDRTVFSNVNIMPLSDLIPQTYDPYQTVTINSSKITFPLLQSSFTNFSLSFEFKSPENMLLFLSFQLKQYYFSLRKDYKQLILELNLHGSTEPLIVELSTISEWTSVEVVVSDKQTILSIGNQKNEVKTHSSVAHKRYERRPLFFGYSEASGYGFRGCLRNFVLNGEMFPLYDAVLSHTNTLVGCFYPTPNCDTLSCPFSCSQTWDGTKCVSVAELPSTAEFAGFGIIQLNVPSLISPEDTMMTIKMTFVSRSSKADVLLDLYTIQDMKSFLTIQMLEGFVMLSHNDVMLNTDLPLNDGQSHTVTVVFNSDVISFQVDTRIKRLSHQIDIGAFLQPVSIKIGGSSLKLNNYGFAGCLSDITINALELLALATSLESSDVVIQDVLLGQCSMIKEELETESNLQNATRSGETSTFSTYSKGAADDESGQVTSVPSSKYNSYNTDSAVIQRDEPRKEEQQLLIGLMLGFVTLLAVLIFLAYFLWQRRQMHQAAKERQRKSSDDAGVDEEFLKKTYNPGKQDKFTLFTPHALDAIEEETESLDMSSMASFSL